jgi:hypothetical protein
MLCLLVYCSVGATPVSHLDQRLAREADARADAAAGRSMCRTTGGCALRVTNLRKQQIRRACMAECGLIPQANTTGRLPPPVPPLRPPPTSEGAVATDPTTVVPLPPGHPGAQVVQGAARATEAAVATRVDVVLGAVNAWMKAAALVAVGVVATVAVGTRVARGEVEGSGIA